MALSSLLPILEGLGLTVVEEVPTRLEGAPDDGAYLHDFGVLVDGAQLDLDRLALPIEQAVLAILAGDAESDLLNGLVTRAALPWEDVQMLRAYRRYRQMVRREFTETYQSQVLIDHAETAALIIALFHARFGSVDAPATEAEADALRDEIAARIDAVPSLDEDRILRGFLQLVLATTRTNAYRPDRGRRLSLKLRSADVPSMPDPKPLYEIFVCDPEMEGVHLRGGPVARGGIRWSDRREDYRTEVLGLMKAQMVKNAVIVPVGSKGGFVLKRPLPADRGELDAEVRRQYSTLIRGLLDVTDTMVAGAVVHPPDVRVHDGDDPYLVVAADKGTAALSDTANAIAIEYGFWLGDAFASGGSTGYDHKALGITARGAWESVRRHFRELGHDVQERSFTVVGIGDMSGDVFGNGMLRSSQIRLIGAFDHRHVFVDPSPDPARSFAERARLFALGGGSSWADYDPAAISPGGGVFPRSAKSIAISPEARTALGITAASLTPAELCQAILRAPADLLWNGGIGTFVKASTESNDDVGDRANDAIRVDGRELRARVVAEGGNLGATQAGRIEYALAGGRINTDAIDNSAGVDCSDHEVNLKVLVDLAVERGRVAATERNALLASVADDVCTQVLYDNYLQVQILSQEEAAASELLESHEALMLALEADGLLDRQLEFLPSSEVVAERARAGRGLTRPELSVLMGHAKLALRERVLASTVPDDRFMQRELRDYFPRRVLEATGDLYLQHPLRREIAATIATNEVINDLGISWVWRCVAETGAEHADVVRAFYVARAVCRGEGSLGPGRGAVRRPARRHLDADGADAERRLARRGARALVPARARPRRHAGADRSRPGRLPRARGRAAPARHERVARRARPPPRGADRARRQRRGRRGDGLAPGAHLRARRDRGGAQLRPDAVGGRDGLLPARRAAPPRLARARARQRRADEPLAALGAGLARRRPARAAARGHRAPAARGARRAGRAGRRPLPGRARERGRAARAARRRDSAPTAWRTWRRRSSPCARRAQRSPEHCGQACELSRTCEMTCTTGRPNFLRACSIRSRFSQCERDAGCVEITIVSAGNVRSASSIAASGTMSPTLPSACRPSARSRSSVRSSRSCAAADRALPGSTSRARAGPATAGATTWKRDVRRSSIRRISASSSSAPTVSFATTSTRDMASSGVG